MFYTGSRNTEYINVCETCIKEYKKSYLEGNNDMIIINHDNII